MTARVQTDDKIEPWSVTFEAGVIAFILASTLVRLVVAAHLPLAFDEALYWRYSQHLAAGYIDHPFMNPLMIRIGTSLFGDTPLGVRFMAVMLTLPASWAVWRAAYSLFHDERVAATAALFFVLTPIVTIGSMMATSDQVVVVTTCFVIFFLARLNETARGEWWLAIGASLGLGLCSKYTTAFFAVSIALWLALSPRPRKWLLSPWPWAGAAVALVLFSPVLLWNAQHHWASLVYQSGRLAVHQWTLRYAAELLGALIFLATPSIFILGALGLTLRTDDRGRFRSERTLLAAMIAPMVAYFFWHSLHERVQGNWPEPAFPAFVIAAAFAAVTLQGRAGAAGSWARAAVRWATPVGVGIALIVYAQGTLHLIPLKRDPVARVLGVGWTDLGRELEAVRQRTGASAILTTDYTLDGWIRFYLPSKAPVEQVDQRVRWINEPPPRSDMFASPALYVCRNACEQLVMMQSRFRRVEPVAVLHRRSRGVEIGRYGVFRLSDPIRPVLDSVDVLPTAGTR